MLNSNSESRPDAEKCLIFLHIPKAAGTTLYNIMGRQYPPSATHDIYGVDLDDLKAAYDRFRALPQEEKNRIRLLRGHVAFGIHEDFSRPSTYVTMLRHPVERIISHYYYVLRMPKHYLYHEIKSKKMGLAEYVTSGVTSELANGQTRLLSGIMKTADVDFSDPRVSSDVVEAARRNMREHFVAVGLAERFDESLILLKRLLGWGNIYYARENITKGRPAEREIPKETIRLIEKYNEADMELYESAQKMFDERLREEVPALKSELKSFQRLNRFYNAAWSKGYRPTRQALHRVKAALKGLRPL
jgi:hypothetical protein